MNGTPEKRRCTRDEDDESITISVEIERRRRMLQKLFPGSIVYSQLGQSDMFVVNGMSIYFI